MDKHYENNFMTTGLSPFLGDTHQQVIVMIMMMMTMMMMTMMTMMTLMMMTIKTAMVMIGDNDDDDTDVREYENIVAVDYTFDEEGFENSSDLA